MLDRPDAGAQAALAADVRRPVTICWLDVLGDPLRATDAPYDLAITGSGDVELDGFTYRALDGRIVGVGAVKAKEGGSDALTLTLSGLAGVDDEIMDLIADKTNWQGRTARLWKAMLDPQTLQRTGSVWAYYTGYMSVPKIVGDAKSQTIQLDVESYLGFFTQASGRSYIDQSSYDPGDHSAELAIAIANGASART
jgi:hypothetical protein